MKKLHNIQALAFAVIFSAIFIGRLGEAEIIDIVALGLAVISMSLMFIASNMKPKNKKTTLK